jgi:hypothetical protein
MSFRAKISGLYEQRPGRPPHGEPSEPFVLQFRLCRAFRGLAVQSCGGMPNLLLPPGHVVREPIHGLRG